MAKLQSAVFYHTQPYNQYTDKSILTKIVKRNVYLSNEINNVAIINSILHHKSFFYNFNNVQDLNITKFSNTTHYLKTGQTICHDKTALLEFDSRKMVCINIYFKTISCPRKYVYQLIYFYTHLLEAIALLVTSNIIHNNINFSTIIIENNETSMLENFTFSINMHNINDTIYIRQFFINYQPSYDEWPMEFHILSYLLTNNLHSLSYSNINFVINDVAHYHFMNSFDAEIITNYKSLAFAYFKKYINKSYEYIIDDIAKFYNTWDNYALSITYLRMLICIHSAKNNSQNQFITLFIQLLVTNIHFNPTLRLSIKNTTNKFGELLNSCNCDNLHSLIQTI